MFTKVNPNTSKTKEFEKYLLEKIIVYFPLSVGDLIETTFIEGTTPFPSFIENPLKDNEGKIITTLDVIEKEKIPLKYEGADRSKSVAILHKPERDCAKWTAVIKYVEDLSGELYVIKHPHVLSSDPLTIKFPFLIKNPEKIYEEAQNLEISINKYDKLIKEAEPLYPHTLPLISYNKNTGIGYANGKRFKFKNNQPEFVIFSEMYENINKSVSKKRILELAGYQGGEEGILENLTRNVKRKKSSLIGATYFINELVKKMRRMTGLIPDYIVMNNGDLTLVGEKLKTSPK